jgi:hypothetical protein
VVTYPDKLIVPTQSTKPRKQTRDRPINRANGGSSRRKPNRSNEQRTGYNPSYIKIRPQGNTLNLLGSQNGHASAVICVSKTKAWRYLKWVETRSLTLCWLVSNKHIIVNIVVLTNIYIKKFAVLLLSLLWGNSKTCGKTGTVFNRIFFAGTSLCSTQSKRKTM